MAWSASTLYAQGVPALRTLLAADPILGPHLHHIRRLTGARFPAHRHGHGLPEGGLLAVRDVYPPDGRHIPALPWDALHGPANLRLAFTRAEQFGKHLPEPARPPPAALRFIKHLAQRAGQPIAWYVCEMWGGDIDLEAAWIPGWRPGEPDRLITFAGNGRVLVSAGGRPREEDGDTLCVLLEYLRLRLPSPFFVPHTGGFDWPAHKIGDAPPIASHERDEQPLHPESLWTCVLHGDLPRARRLLERGVDPNVYADTTPLDLAARRARLDLVDLLLAHGADPQPGPRTALHEATSVACAERLLTAGVPVDGPAEIHTPLVFAADRGDSDVARLLVARGAAIQPAAHPRSVWYAACRGGLVWLVDALLAAGLDPRLPEHDGGQGGLAYAAAHGRVDVFMRLLAAGCDLSDRTWREACRGGAVPLIDLHLARGHDPDDEQYGWTVLGTALRHGHAAAAARLLAAGADPLRPSFHQTPLYVAAWHDVPDAIDAILARCPDPAAALETPADMGWTPLFAAVWSGHRECAARLLARGARHDLVDEHGRSLRDQAARHGIPLP